MLYARAKQEIKHIPIYIYMYGSLGFLPPKRIASWLSTACTVDVIGADTSSPTRGLDTFATFKLWMPWKAMLFQWLEVNTSIICLKEIHIPMPLPFFPAGCDCLPECILNVGKRNQWCKSHWWWQWAFKNCKIDLYLNHQHEKKKTCLFFMLHFQKKLHLLRLHRQNFGNPPFQEISNRTHCTDPERNLSI